jgi:hypothetical protein
VKKDDSIKPLMEKITKECSSNVAVEIKHIFYPVGAAVTPC